MTVWRRRLESRSKECMQTHIRRQIFYHKTDDCKFIRRVPKEELLIFDSEEAAIQNGRFINRCRECFSKDG